jgi:hypothetical protein
VYCKRAWAKYGTYTYANGSNQYMGLYNTYTVIKLRKKADNYYVIDSSCP